MGKTIQVYLTQRDGDVLISRTPPTAEQKAGWPEPLAKDQGMFEMDLALALWPHLDEGTTAKVLITVSAAPATGTYA